MNWFHQNRFLGTFLALLGFAILLSGYFLFHEKSAAGAAQTRLEANLAELNRLRASAPFPNGENLRKTGAQTESYRDSLLALENELKTRMFPRPPLQPNEFQGLLRDAVTAVIDRAHASKVQLPQNFNLGFDEYATSLPNSLAAPRLGRQLRAIEWIVNTIVGAHVDSLQSLTRSPLPEEKAAPSPSPAAKGRAAGKPKTEAGAKIVDWTTLDLTFSGSPAATRRVLNQIATAQEQTYIIRTVQIRNQADKGPKRGSPAPAGVSVSPPAPAGAAKRRAEPAITFIVGTEHLNVAARIEILRFNFPEKGVR